MTDASKARDAALGVIAVCDTLIELTAVGWDAFEHDVRSQWAVEMGLIRIGEGINRIPEAVLDRFDGQPWAGIVSGSPTPPRCRCTEGGGRSSV